MISDCKFGVYFDGVVVAVDRLIVFFSVIECTAEEAISNCIIGVELEGGFVAFDCLFVFTKALEY